MTHDSMVSFSDAPNYKFLCRIINANKIHKTIVSQDSEKLFVLLRRSRAMPKPDVEINIYHPTSVHRQKHTSPFSEVDSAIGDVLNESARTA